MKIRIVLFYLLFIVLAGCSSLVLKPGDFAWPVESELKVDGNGFVKEERHSFSLNVKELLFAETQDSSNMSKVKLRMIRDVKGYYFITASKFKNVYVFEQTEGGLKLASKILIDQTGITNPALNQRAPNIQLIIENKPPILLNKDGVVEGVKK